MINNDDFCEKEIEDIDEEDLSLLDEEEEKEEKEFENIDVKKINTLNFKTHQKNMYFDENKIVDLIVNKYQPSLKYDKDGKIIERDSEAEEEIMASLLLIARAIINKYSYWRFDNVEDLEAECLKECWKYLPKFTPGKGTAFNLFSILCKRHLLNFTLKGARHRLTADIDIFPDAETKKEINYNIFFEDIESTFLRTINEHFLGKKRKKYVELTSILMEYLIKNKMIVGKNDLISSFREYGYKSSDYKNFIIDMSKYKQDFYMLAS